MQNQRLLFSQNKRPRPVSINKQNNLKLFNDFLINDSLPFNKRSTDLRYDYENSTRISNRNAKNVSDEYLQKQDQKSAIQKTPELKQFNKSFQITSFQQSTKKVYQSSSQQQIESYTNKLLENNQLYQQQIFQLKQQNAKLRSEVQNSIAENIKFRMSVDKRQDQVKDKFNQEISNLVRELKDILLAKEQMEQEYNKYIQEMVEEHGKQMEGREERFTKSEDFFKEKLINLKSHISLNKEEKEKQFFQASQCKLRLMKQIDELNYSIQKQKDDRRQLQKSNQEMIKVVKSLERQLRETKLNLENAEVEVFKIQKQKNEIIIELRTQNKTLCQGIEGTQTKIKNLDSSLSKKQIQFTRLEREILDLKKDFDQKSKNLLQTTFELQQRKNQLKLTQQQTSKQINSFFHQKSQFQSLVEQLESSIRSLSSELSQKEQQYFNVDKQLTLLNSQHQTLQRQNSKLTVEMTQLQELNKKYKKDNIQFLQELELLILQNKSMKEDKILKDNHLRTLEQMCEQLQKSRDKSKQFQAVNFKRYSDIQRSEAVKLKQRNNEIDEIERIVKRKYQIQLIDLQDQNIALKQQIDFVVSEYERKLKQTEEKWQMRVEHIENELETLLMGEKEDIYKNKFPQEQFISRRNVERVNQTMRKETERKQNRSPYIAKNSSIDESSINRHDVLASLPRRQAQRSSYEQRESPQQSKNKASYERRDFIQDYNEGNSFRRKQIRYYQDIEKKLNEFSSSRKLYA